MKINITNIYGMSGSSTALMAQNDVVSIMAPQNYRELGFYFYNIYTDSETELQTRMDGIMASVGYGDVVVYQSPSWNGREFDQLFIRKCKILNTKLITFIHDVPPLMFVEANWYLMPEFIEMYNQSDVLIVPSQQMKEKLISEGLKVEKILIQEMWDHPYNGFLYQPQFEKKLYFAGSVERFPHLLNWSHETPLHVFSEGGNDIATCHFEGFKSDAELMLQLSKGGFGLVWGTSENPIDEPEYYKINISHKVSTYLAAGIPVLVPSYLSTANIIREKGLGFVVDNLQEASERVANCTQEEYQAMVDRIHMTSFLLRQGFYTKKVLTDAIMALGE